MNKPYTNVIIQQGTYTDKLILKANSEHPEHDLVVGYIQNETEKIFIEKPFRDKGITLQEFEMILYAWRNLNNAKK
tara:strand:+ start:98 stop:325 length:228 start_codon:yes stop_codon:yes gene_type:complete